MDDHNTVVGRSDLCVLRIATDDVALVIINNGYASMANPIHLDLNTSVIPRRVVNMIAGGLKHWKTGRSLTVQNGKVLATPST